MPLLLYAVFQVPQHAAAAGLTQVGGCDTQPKWA